ncbi:MAG TPA: hypothetical protein DCS07_01280 [Bdellovibrionales bacterium]|nr:MAG: hypothetical protein A2Z97_15995 [Bdellovibrionales bacterium GWB1_52_6]OFZ03070.1 MAG: hypothetical protein A2X97_09515 [Bdellovibrionales bacterium GWA1_52_35]OFZ43295.1 MAG: hypothetical protein A2070_07665 [Bdellovibrionales bacterium GWC1_52_8]HAR41259.1 hypothetical protein [Bdellovibrionales bacterium]HCM40395.1 hypothetical protein [Bdellovibrionales bacterium]
MSGLSAKLDSLMFPKHHMNWRMRSIHVLDHISDEDLFFSGPICLSEKNAKLLRARILEFLEETKHCSVLCARKGEQPCPIWVSCVLCDTLTVGL